MRGKMFIRAVLVAWLGLLLGSGATFAGENATTDTSSAFSLGEIEVIEQADGTPNVSVEQVTAETMRTFNTDRLPDALNLLPGVTLNKVGARNEMMVEVRGLDTKHVPIYLDGIPIYVPYDGYPDLNRFTTYDLANVTVSKGFSSVLYGPNTMGGAINMVSRKPQKEFEASVGLGAGSNNWNTYFNLGTNQGLWYLQAAGSHMNLDSYPLSHDYEDTITENGGTRENSYTQDTKGSIKLGLTPNSKDEYAITYINQHGEKGTPPYAGTSSSETPRYWQWPYWDKESIYFNSNTWLGDDFYVKSRLYYDKFRNSLYSYDDATYSTMKKKSSFKSAYDDHTQGGSLELGTFILPSQELRLALHYKEDFHEEWAPNTPDVKMEESVFSVGLEDTIHLSDDFYAIAGISYDYVDTKHADNLVNGVITDFPTSDADAINPQLGLFYKVTPEGIVHASVAMKSRMPSIKDKFSYKLGKALPNPELDPERSINYEIGYKHTYEKWLTGELNLFYNDMSDYILSKTIPNPSKPTTTLLQNQNIGDVDMYGAEVGITAKIIDPLTVGVNYTYIEYDNKTNDDEILNTPTHKIFGYIEYRPWESLSLLADIEHDSDRYSSSDGMRVAEGFTTVNAKATYEFADRKYLEVGMNNIFDTDYEYEEGYPEAGQTWFANVRLEF